MSRVKITMLTLFATLAFSVVAVASASAGWFVGGAELKTSAALSTTAIVHQAQTLLVPALKLSIVCSGKSLDGVSPEIIAGSTGKAASLKFLECNTTAPATGCALEKANESITTNLILARAILGPGEAVKILFAADSTFTIIKFNEANTCAFGGEEPVKGELVINVPTGQLELLSQAIEGLGSIENNSLEIGAGNKAFLDGGLVLLRLASDSKWSFK